MTTYKTASIMLETIRYNHNRKDREIYFPSNLFKTIGCSKRKKGVPRLAASQPLPPPVIYNAPIGALIERNADARAIIEEISIQLSVTINGYDSKYLNFLVVAFNYFVQDEVKKLHMPAEVSIAVCSLYNGVNRVYSIYNIHRSDMFGFEYSAKEHSENTHMLPIPSGEKSDSDCFVDAYAEIIKIMQTYGDRLARDDKALPPLYTHMEHIPVVQSCLAYLRNMSPEQPEIKVLPLQFLGEELMSRSVKVDFSEKLEADAAFKIYEKDLYEYNDKIACDFHDSVDRVRYCTQHRVIRWFYNLSDLLGPFYDYQKAPISHYPPKENRVDNNNLTIIIMGKADFVEIKKTEDKQNQNILHAKILQAVNPRRGGAANITNGRHPNKARIVGVSDKLLSEWNTKKLGTPHHGFGRGHQ